MTTNAADDEIEALPYATDSLFVKLAATSNPFSIMANVGVASETAGSREYGEAEEDKKTLADYGDISLLFRIPPDSGTGVSVFGAAASEAWYGLKLKDGQNVDEAYAALQADPNVIAVNYNYLISIADGEDTVHMLSVAGNVDKPEAEETGTSSIDTSDIYFYNKYQATIMENTGVTAAQNYLEAHGMNPRGSSDVVVAILDSGVDYTHPELAPNMLRSDTPRCGKEVHKHTDDCYKCGDKAHEHTGDCYECGKEAHSHTDVCYIIGYDATRGGGDPGPDESFNNDKQKATYMHGTHCAGIVAAKGINVLGVASNVKLMPVTVISSAKADFWALIDGIKFAVENGADIINMSIGVDVTASTMNNIINGDDANALHDLIKQYYRQVLFVAAAGNKGYPNEATNGKAYNRSYPAAWPEVFAVMNTKKTAEEGTDWLNSTSNWDVNPHNEYEYEIMAPGTELASTTPNNSYAYMTGTSQAAPFVSGCLALLLTQYREGIENGEFTVQDMLRILKDNSEIKQGITFAYVRYKYPYVRIDNALEFRTELDVALAPYHYFYNGVSDEADRGVGSVSASRKDNGAKIGRALNYDYKYEKKQPVQDTGDYIIEAFSTAPEEAGEYEVAVNVDELYYTGTASSLYTVFDRQCDFNGDGQISYLDMEVYRRHLGTRTDTTSGSGRSYEALLDLNKDGKIDISDVQCLISMRYQESLKKN